MNGRIASYLCDDASSDWPGEESQSDARDPHRQHGDHEEEGLRHTFVTTPRLIGQVSSARATRAIRTGSMVTMKRKDCVIPLWRRLVWLARWAAPERRARSAQAAWWPWRGRIASYLCDDASSDWPGEESQSDARDPHRQHGDHEEEGLRHTFVTTPSLIGQVSSARATRAIRTGSMVTMKRKDCVIPLWRRLVWLARWAAPERRARSAQAAWWPWRGRIASYLCDDASSDWPGEESQSDARDPHRQHGDHEEEGLRHTFVTTPRLIGQVSSARATRAIRTGSMVTMKRKDCVIPLWRRLVWLARWGEPERRARSAQAAWWPWRGRSPVRGWSRTWRNPPAGTGSSAGGSPQHGPISACRILKFVGKIWTVVKLPGNEKKGKLKRFPYALSQCVPCTCTRTFSQYFCTFGRIKFYPLLLHNFWDRRRLGDV